MLGKIISGGQTGVDRGALDAAIDLKFPCGGYCPADRMAEDGQISNAYPLTALEKGGYRERTIKNVVESDATLIIYFTNIEGGTEQTLMHCRRRDRKYILIDGDTMQAESAARMILAFIEKESITTLNVAGPRQSKASQAYRYTYAVLSRVIREHCRPN